MHTGDETRQSERVLAKGAVLSDTYRIVRMIAVGGMGVVYEAEHLRLGGHRVAIKVLLPEVTGSAETMARFRREAEICSRLQHPHIIRVTDFNALDDGKPYFAMEYLEGESLNILMDREGVTSDEARAIIRQTATALEAAHGQGIVHRDLKPSNVFLAVTDTAPGGVGGLSVKVLDFGISKVLTEGTLHAGSEPRVLGTPRYMSPEQAEGRNEMVGPASDQFSLASIAHELLTGRKAFSGDTPAAVLYKVVHGEPEALVMLDQRHPPGVAAALRRAMQKKPQDRYPSVAAFVDDLDAGFSRRRRERSPGRWRGFVAFLVVAAFVAGVILLLQQERYQPDPDEPRPAATLTGRKPPPVTRPPIEEKPTVAPRAEPPAVPVEPAEPDAINRKVEGVLDVARRHYDQKEFRETIDLATQSLRLKPTGRAHVLITLSHCSLGEADQARNAVTRVPASRRTGTIAQCKHLGVDLETEDEPGREP